MRIRFAKPLIGEKERNKVVDVLKRTSLTNSGCVREFEEKFRDFIGGGEAVAVSSCTAALHLGLLAGGVGPGDEVIVPALTFAASAHAVEAVGARPVFVDVWKTTGVIESTLFGSSLTKKTKAIMPVHFAGRPGYMGGLRDFARRNKLFVVEDCATALGARHSGQHVGLLGDCGAFSFHPVKHITSCEGGMLVSRNPELADSARRMREFGKVSLDLYAGMPGEYDIKGFGLNYRMTEMQGAVGTQQLEDFPERFAQRRLNYKILSNLLSKYELLDLDHENGSSYCVVLMLPDGVDQREFRLELTRKDIETSIYYPGPLPLFTYYREKYGHKSGDFPNAERISRNSVALSVGPHLGRDHMVYMSDEIKRILG